MSTSPRSSATPSTAGPICWASPAATVPRRWSPGIAAEHDIPLLVISAGTRNHFALDLGLDREDPATCLQALTDGEEVRVDLGYIADRPFVNNASFGAYAEIVQSPEYRDNKERTILNMLPDLLGKQKGADLAVRTVTAAGPTRLQDMQAVLISNNPYGSGRLLDMGRRYRLDEGVLGVIAGRLGSTAEAVGLLRRQQFRSVNALRRARRGRRGEHRHHHPGGHRR